MANIMKLDTIGIIARILVILGDQNQRRSFFTQVGSQAQLLLDLLQAVRNQNAYIHVAAPDF
jgi:hypothetical protein